MARNVYEAMVLLDSNRYARNPGGVAGQIADTVTRLGGEVLVSRLWSEQKLAYPIGTHRKGTYWLTYFRLDSLKQAELTRQLRLNENVLRTLILRVDERLVDTLVAHASGAAASPAAGEGKPAEKQPPEKQPAEKQPAEAP